MYDNKRINSMAIDIKSKTFADKFAPLYKGGAKLIEKTKQHLMETAVGPATYGLVTGITYGAITGNLVGSITVGVGGYIGGYIGEQLNKKFNKDTLSNSIVNGIKKIKQRKEK